MSTSNDIKPFKCGCNGSARFMPLYRFNDGGDKPAVLLQHAPAIKCAGCNQMYTWDGGGWRRDTPLEDLIKLEESNG